LFEYWNFWKRMMFGNVLSLGTILGNCLTCLDIYSADIFMIFWQYSFPQSILIFINPVKWLTFLFWILSLVWVFSVVSRKFVPQLIFRVSLFQILTFNTFLYEFHCLTFLGENFTQYCENEKCTTFYNGIKYEYVGPLDGNFITGYSIIWF